LKGDVVQNGNRSISAVLSDIVGNIQHIVRSEMQLAKTEIKEELAKSRSAGILLGVGVLLLGGGIDRRRRAEFDRGAMRGPGNPEVQVRESRTEDQRHRQGERGMGQTTDQIATDIARTRDDLKSNLEELETRVKDVADWRSQFRKHPGAMLTAAVLGGALLSAMMSRR
jgi:hypothetical protein